MEEKKKTDVMAFRVEFTNFTPELKKVLPPHVTPEKFERTVLSAVQINPDLLFCDRKTLFSSCLKAASDGLLPDGKEAALVPFKDKNHNLLVQYIPMVYGIVKKIRNSGELKSMSPQIVYENDEFDYFIDENGEHIHHKPNFKSDRGNPIGVYVIMKTKDDGIYFEYMTKSDVMSVRAVSRAKFGPWEGPFALEMWKKTAIRRLSKRVPMSSDIEQTIARDDEMIDLDSPVLESKAKKIEHILESRIEKNKGEQPAEKKEEPGEFDKFVEGEKNESA